MNTHTPVPDALVAALGRVVAEKDKEWKREVDRIASDARATIAGMQATIADLRTNFAAEVQKAVDVAMEKIVGGMVINREGHLIAAGKDLGPVVGEPGRDGFDFEDMTEEVSDDGRTITRRYTKGDEVREFKHRFAIPLDRGVFKAGTTYAKGDAVSFGGSLWIAQSETAAKPGEDPNWRLAVKHGRDGRDAKKVDA